MSVECNSIEAMKRIAAETQKIGFEIGREVPAILVKNGEKHPDEQQIPRSQGEGSHSIVAMSSKDGVLQF